MFLKYSLLLLGLVVGFQCYEICNFEKHLCKWYHLYSCHFTLETKKPLVGEKGYLLLSKNTCKKAGIYFAVNRFYHRFQLHYFINGTGRGMLAVYTKYSWSGRSYIWSCNINHGPRWNKADFFVMDEGILDSLDYIGIEATVHGDMTIAIGNISPAYSGNVMSKCPPPPVTKKPITSTRKPTSDTPKTTTSPQTTTSFITSQSEPETEPTTHGDRKSTEKHLRTFTTIAHSSAQSSQKDATTVTARDHPNPATTIGPQQSTNTPQDVTTSRSASGGINGAETGKMKQQQGSKSKQGAIIGGSVFAAVFVIVVTVIGVLLYKRKIKIWDVQGSKLKSLENPLYR